MHAFTVSVISLRTVLASVLIETFAGFGLRESTYSPPICSADFSTSDHGETPILRKFLYFLT